MHPPPFSIPVLPVTEPQPSPPDFGQFSEVFLTSRLPLAAVDDNHFWPLPHELIVSVLMDTGYIFLRLPVL